MDFNGAILQDPGTFREVASLWSSSRLVKSGHS